ncbi:MAG: AtpZ/AtpI family protein [Patescibacteria group bacterium]|jgi:F0F1-type ATP synthase assembly protein I
MTDTQSQSEAREKANRLISEAPRRWLDATVTILIIVGLFAFLGRYLDNLLGTRPWLFITGIVVAFPISQYAIYRRLKQRFKL